jgi:ribosome-binding protein aMBF1 (putative translation factor)
VAVVEIHLDNREVYKIHDDTSRDEAVALYRSILVEHRTFVVHNSPMRNAREQDFGTRVMEARKARLWSQTDLAHHMNRSVNWVAQVERGTRFVDRVSIMQQLANVLAVKLSDLTDMGAPSGTDGDVVLIPAESVRYIRIR